MAQAISNEKKDRIIQSLRKFFEDRWEIIFAYIHGSFAQELPFNDIDVAIYVDENAVPEYESIDYGLMISAQAEIETRIMPIDVKVINYASLGFKFYATKGILLFSKDEDIRCEFLENVWKMYFDLLPKRKEILLDMLSP